VLAVLVQHLQQQVQMAIILCLVPSLQQVVAVAVLVE